METYQEAQEYLAKGVRGKKWYISLAIVFAHLPEGDDRVGFVQKHIGDIHFGKEFLANYQPNSPYKTNPYNGRTSLEIEMDSYSAFVSGIDPAVDEMETIASYLRKEMNGNPSEILLIHLFLLQVVKNLCQGKKHNLILARAESLLKNGFAEEAFLALDYIDSDWIISRKDLIFEFISGGYYGSWKGISIPIDDFFDVIPKEIQDKLADWSFDSFVDRFKRLDVQSMDSKLENDYYNARNLSQKGFGHHTPQEIDKYLDQIWKEAGNTSNYDFETIGFKKVLMNYLDYKKQKEQEDRKKREEKELELWKIKADNVVRFIKTGETDDPELLNDEEIELSDVLQDILDNYPEEIQIDIFNKILNIEIEDEEDEEKDEYIENFIGENIDDVPFAFARNLAIGGFEPALERIKTAIWEGEITFWDDPILFYVISDEFPDWDMYYYDDIYEYLQSDNPDPDVIEFFAEKEKDNEECLYYVAKAYHTVGNSLKALEICGDIYKIDDIVLDDYLEEEWFVEVLQGALETNEEEAKEIIRNIDLNEEKTETILKECSEVDSDLMTKLRELWQMEEKGEILEQEENDQLDYEQSEVKESKHEEAESQEQKSEREKCTKQEQEKKNDEHHRKVERKEEIHIQEEDDLKEQGGEINHMQEGEMSPEQEPKKEEDIEEQQKQEQGKKNDEHHRKVEGKEETHIQEEDDLKEQGGEINYMHEEEMSTEQEPKKEEDIEEQQKQEQGKKVEEQSSQKPAIDNDDANALFALYQEKGGIKILKKAAKLGHAEAQYQLGLHLMELHQETPLWKKAIKAVKGKKTNKEKAMWWFMKAAEQGHEKAIKWIKG